MDLAPTLRCAWLLHSSNVACTKSDVKQLVEESQEMPANWHKISCTTPILWTTRLPILHFLKWSFPCTEHLFDFVTIYTDLVDNPCSRSTRTRTRCAMSLSQSAQAAACAREPMREGSTQSLPTWLTTPPVSRSRSRPPPRGLDVHHSVTSVPNESPVAYGKP